MTPARPAGPAAVWARRRPPTAGSGTPPGRWPSRRWCGSRAAAYSNLVLPGLLRDSGLDGRDRALVTDLVYGTLRQQGQADHLLACARTGPCPTSTRRCGPPCASAPTSSSAGSPPHAAVGATVGALAGWSSPASVRRAAPYANAVLRRVAALGPAWPWPAGDDPDAVAVRTSHPRWIVELLRARPRRRGRRRPRLGQRHPRPSPCGPTRCAPPRRPWPAELAAGRRRRAGRARRLVPGALLVRGAGDLARLPAVAEGRATPQDQASQAVAAAVGARPGERHPRPGRRPRRQGHGPGRGHGRRRPRRGRRPPPRPGRPGPRRRPPPRPALGPGRRRRRPRTSRSARPATAASTGSSSTPRAPASASSAAAPRPAGGSTRPTSTGSPPSSASSSRPPWRQVRPGGLVAYCVCTLTRRGDPRHRRLGRRRLPVAHRRARPRARPGAPTAAAPSCSPPPPAPTGCSCSCSRLAARDRLR